MAVTSREHASGREINAGSTQAPASYGSIVGPLYDLKPALLC